MPARWASATAAADSGRGGSLAKDMSAEPVLENEASYYIPTRPRTPQSFSRSTRGTVWMESFIEYGRRVPAKQRTRRPSSASVFTCLARLTLSSGVIALLDSPIPMYKQRSKTLSAAPFISGCISVGLPKINVEGNVHRKRSWSSALS